MKFGAVDVDYLISLQEKYQIFEKLIESLYRSVLRQGDHAIDGGAHVAMHTLPMAECVGPNGTVYAFEPSPTVLPWLRELLAPARNVVLIERALSDQDGTAVFRNLPDEPWLSSLDNRPLGSFKLACCRFRGHRDKVFNGIGERECNDGGSAASSSLRL